MQILTMSAMSLSFIVATPSVSFAAGAAQGGSKPSAQICPDGNPCPALPAGSIDCTPKAGKALPVECSLAPGKGVNEPEEFDVSSLPGISVTPGAAKSATTFNLGPLKAALGKYAAMPVFFVNYGDGTGEEIEALSQQIQADVAEKFGIDLQPEVNFI